MGFGDSLKTLNQMVFKKFFLSKKNTRLSSVYENPCFGQFAGLEKSKQQSDFFEKAKSLFKKQQLLDAFEYFFKYLENQDTENLAYTREHSKIDFSLIQGSKIIRGFINEQEIYAESEIVSFEDTDIPVMKQLLEENFQLKYCKFAIKNNHYSLKFYGIATDISPESLYDALHEMAVWADRYDDFLLNNFKGLKNLNVQHIHHIEGRKTEERIEFFKTQLNYLKSIFNSEDFTGDAQVAYYEIINSLYSIIYLTGVGGSLQERIRKLIFKLEKSGIENLNEILSDFKAEINKITTVEDELLLADLQGIIKTFPEKYPESEIADDAIENNLLKAKVLIDKQELQTGELLLANIVFSLPFKMNMSFGQERILLVLWEYFYPDFFQKTALKSDFFDHENRFNEQMITEYIKHANKSLIKKFQVADLCFDDKFCFLFSFLRTFINTK